GRAAHHERIRLERGQARGRRRLRVLSGALLIGGLLYLGWANGPRLRLGLMRLAEAVSPRVLTATAEQALRAGDSFSECFGCPEMVVVPAGAFMMGSPADEKERK